MSEQAFEVSNCHGCPLHWNDEHCSAAAFRRTGVYAEDPPPEWCPLRSGPTVVRLAATRPREGV